MSQNRQAIFFDEPDLCAWFEWLKEAADRWACRIHAYVLMTDHAGATRQQEIEGR